MKRTRAILAFVRLRLAQAWRAYNLWLFGERAASSPRHSSPVTPHASDPVVESLVRMNQDLASRLAERCITLGHYRELVTAVKPVFAMMAQGQSVQATDGGASILAWLARAQQTGLIARADGTYAGPPDGVGRLMAELRKHTA